MLTIFNTPNREMMLMQTSWSSDLNPLLKNPALQGYILKDVSLVSGDNIISHRLGRKIQGWMIVGINASVSIYDKQSTNVIPEFTLVLNSSGTATVNIYVF